MVFIQKETRNENKKVDLQRRNKYYVKKYKRLNKLTKTVFGRNTKQYANYNFTT